jgi:serine protease Do
VSLSGAGVSARASRCSGNSPSVTVTVFSAPLLNSPSFTAAPDSDTGRLGLTLAPAGSVGGAGSQGVVVTRVEADGLAAQAGFKTGDVILDIGGKMVGNPADVRKALADARGQGKRNVLMRVKSSGATKFVAMPLGRA